MKYLFYLKTLKAISGVRMYSLPARTMKSSPYFVYILQSNKDASFYIGQCEDLDRRMAKHAEGMSKYTASRRPLRLVYFEMYSSHSEALRREQQIKKKKSR